MRFRPTGTVFGVSLILLIALCCVAANAQSGRRQTKPPSVAPVPTPTPEATPKPAPKDDEDKFSFFVATGDRGARVSRAQLSLHDAATQGCADQLRKRTSLSVDMSLREVSRSQAIAKAKAGTTTYVVLVSLVEDIIYSADGSAHIEFEVDYVVFAPQTAKVMASGRIYEGNRKGPITIGPRGPNVSLPTYREGLLRRAGADAGDRIAKALHLSDLPPKKSTD